MGKEKKKTRQAKGGDWIHLRGVECRCILGVYPAERKKARTVRMDVSLECDARRGAETDRLEDVLNYEQIEAETIATAKQGQFFLIETLAEQVAAACLAHKGVRRVRVTAEKPGALPHTRSVAVEIEREK